MKHRMGFYPWLLVLAAVLSLGVACSKAVADRDLTGEVQNKIQADSGLQGKQLIVQTTDGVVTLSGTVDNDAERSAGSRYAFFVSGGKQDVNYNQVAPAIASRVSEDQAYCAD